MYKLAILGLGAMGQRMATRLIAAGFEVTTWARSGRTLPGGTPAPTPCAAAQSAQITLSMLRDDPASEATWFGPDGAASGLTTGAKPGSLAVEMSTLSPAWTRDWSARIRALGAQPLDIPVAGSLPQAEAGELVLLAGGEADALERFAPVGDALGKATLHAGGAGSGAVLKMVVNALLGVQTTAMSELLRYGAGQGIAPDRLLSLLDPTPVMSPTSRAMGALIAAERHDPLFPIDLIAKDLGYLTEAGHSPDLPLLEATRQRYIAAQAAGRGALNLTAV